MTRCWWRKCRQTTCGGAFFLRRWSSPLGATRPFTKLHLVSPPRFGTGLVGVAGCAARGGPLGRAVALQGSTLGGCWSGGDASSRMRLQFADSLLAHKHDYRMRIRSPQYFGDSVRSSTCHIMRRQDRHVQANVQHSTPESSPNDCRYLPPVKYNVLVNGYKLL